MPETMSIERRKLLKALGANGPDRRRERHEGRDSEGRRNRRQRSCKISAAPAVQQPANPEIHEKTTGPEIWEDTDGQVDVFISGVGTGGTLTGVSRYIKGTKGKRSDYRCR